MAENEQSTPAKGQAAPYTAFQSIKTLIEGLREHGIPGRIDRSVLGNFSGAVAGQILTALRFLDLMDGKGEPTDKLHMLVSAYGGDSWAPTLADILRDAYKPLFQLNLESASPSQFNERFKAVYAGTDEVLRKSMTFFLNATKEAAIKVSPYIMRNKKPRGVSAKRRVKNAAGAATPKPAVDVDDEEEEIPLPPEAKKKPSEMLLEHFDPNKMDEAQQSAVWTLLKYFKAQAL